MAGRDLREKGLLLGIRVEQQVVGCRCAVIRSGVVRVGSAGGDLFAVADVSGESVEHDVVEAAPVAGHRAADVGEGRDHEPRQHGEGVDRSRRGTQAVDHGLGLEDPAVVGEGGERCGVDRDAEVLARDPHELRVHLEGTLQLELEIGMVPSDRQRAKEHGCRELSPADAPSGDPDREVHGFDAADGAQLGVLRGDPLGGEPRGPQTDLVAVEVRQQGGLAGDELGKAAGVGLRDVDAGLDRVAEVDERR